ncbi:MAG: hypothetical protein JOZ69_08270, partial [Myxococcales bacterium]|nr:hypothetical protein [Myxococcales bacterium]
REAWEVLEGQGHRLVKDGKTLVKPEENLAELESRLVQFQEETLPILRRLRIA